jgi:predicted TIM-barrel fold metal-dependent hydrolase
VLKDASMGMMDPTDTKSLERTYNYGLIKGWIENLSISTEDKEKILGKNFEALIKRS